MKLNVNKTIALVFLAFIILLLLPQFLRESDSMIGGESYFITRVAENILHGKFIQDDLSFNGRNVLYDLGLPVILAFLSLITRLNIILISKILMVLFGVLSLYLSYLILQYYKFNNKRILFTLLILIFSPAFLYLFTTLTSFSIVIFLSLLGYLMYLKGKTKLAILFLSLISFFNLLVSFFMLFFVYLYIINKKEVIKKPYNYLLIWNVLLFIILAFKIKMSSFSWFYSWFEIIGISGYISDFGAKFGFSIFALFMSLFGLNVIFKNKMGRLRIYFIVLLMIIFSLYFHWMILFLSFFIVLFASNGVNNFINRSWESKIIKNFTIFIFICGILFSGLSFLNGLSEESPSSELIESLNYINKETSENSVIFSSYEYGHFISGIANRKNVIDENRWFVFGINKKWGDYETLLYSIDIEETKKLLDGYSVDYILIDEKMKEEIWNNEENGLFFLLKYGKEFKKVYSINNVEIWKYKK